MTNELLEVYEKLLHRNQWALWNDDSDFWDKTDKLVCNFERLFDPSDNNTAMGDIRVKVIRYYRAIYQYSK